MAFRTRFTARRAAMAIGQELAAGDTDFAFRLLVTAIADLRILISSGDDESLGDFLVPPATTGSLRWDTLLAGAVGRELRRAGIERPGWTKPRALDRFWFVNDPPSILLARIMQRTAPDLACLGIWVDAKSFETA